MAILHPMPNSSFEPIASFQGHKSAIYALCIDGEAGHFLSGGGEGIVVRWHVDRPEHGEALVNVGEALYSLCVLPDLDLLLIGTSTGRLLVIDRRTRTEVQAIEAHAKGIFRIVRSDARTVACAGGDGSLSTWKLDPDRNKPLTQLRRIPLCDEKLRDIVVSEDGERLVVACGDAALRELDLPSMNERQRFDGHAKGANCVAFHPTKPVLISGGKDGQVKVWRTDGSCMHEFAAHKGSVYATRIDPTGQFLVSIGRDALVKIWDANSLEPVLRSTRARNAHTHSVNAALWFGNVLITASDDRNIRAWQMP
ncbi:MAG: hypothetical protein IPH05_12885 [Flavobacteriales bacterium]|jgi:WD repeat-containing protein 61|nr:hypothetical protein [Flavobacteriales bacterium]